MHGPSLQIRDVIADRAYGGTQISGNGGRDRRRQCGSGIVSGPISRSSSGKRCTSPFRISAQSIAFGRAAHATASDYSPVGAGEVTE